MIAEARDPAVFVVLSWLITYSIHSTVLLGAALLVLRIIPLGFSRFRERLVKMALLGGLVTTSFCFVIPRAPFSFDVSIETEHVRTDTGSPMPARPANVSDGSAGVTAGSGRNYTGLSEASAGAMNGTAIVNWAVASVQFWLFVVIVLNLFYLFRWGRYLAGVKKQDLPASDLFGDGFANIKKSFGIRRTIRITGSSSIKCPMAIGIREICLPLDFTDKLDEDEQHSAFAHELAHLKRGDPLWLIVSDLVSILFFFQPLNRIARRRLRTESELIADELAVEKTQNPAALARSLVKIAGAAFYQPDLQPVLAMTGGSLSLTERTMRMLNWNGYKPRKSTSIVFTILLLGSILLAGWVSPNARVITTSKVVEIGTTQTMPPEPVFQTVEQTEPDTTLTGSLIWIDGEEVTYALKEFPIPPGGFSETEYLAYDGKLVFSDEKEINMSVLIHNKSVPLAGDAPHEYRSFPQGERLRTFVEMLVEKVLDRYNEESLPDVFQIRLGFSGDGEGNMSMVISLNES